MSRHENFDIKQATLLEPIYKIALNGANPEGVLESHDCDRMRYEFLETLAQALKIADKTRRTVQKDPTMTIVDLFDAEAKGQDSDLVSQDFVRAVLIHAENRGGKTSMPESSVRAFDVMTDSIAGTLQQVDDMEPAKFHQGLMEALQSFNRTLSYVTFDARPHPISLSPEGKMFFAMADNRRVRDDARLRVVSTAFGAGYDL